MDSASELHRSVFRGECGSLEDHDRLTSRQLELVGFIRRRHPTAELEFPLAQRTSVDSAQGDHASRIGAIMTYRPHSFTWVPAAQQRHASPDSLPQGAHAYPDSTEITTLCGKTLTATAGELAWLWLTCPDCNTEARTIANSLRRTTANARPTQGR